MVYSYRESQNDMEKEEVELRKNGNLNRGEAGKTSPIQKMNKDKENYNYKCSETRHSYLDSNISQ